jgi:hypothetical protein
MKNNTVYYNTKTNEIILFRFDSDVLAYIEDVDGFCTVYITVFEKALDEGFLILIGWL